MLPTVAPPNTSATAPAMDKPARTFRTALDGDVKLTESLLRAGYWSSLEDMLETRNVESAISNTWCDVVGGVDGTRTRGLRRDRPAF